MQLQYFVRNALIRHVGKSLRSTNMKIHKLV